MSVEGEPIAAAADESLFAAGPVDAGARLDARKASDQQWREGRSELRGADTPGERLEAGLAADQRSRDQRREKLRERLRAAHALGVVAGWVCVAAGWAELFFWGAMVLSVANPGWGMGLYSGLLYGSLILLSLGLVLPPISAITQQHLLKQAVRDAVEIEPAKTPTFPQPLSPHPGVRDRERLGVELQHRIDYNAAVGRILRDVCLFGVRAFWLAALLFVVAFAAPRFVAAVSPLWEIVWWLTLIPALLTPLPALASVFIWFWGKRLFGRGAREGLELQAPAASPWE